MIPISVALEIISAETPKLPSELIPLENSVGRVLAQDILADMDLPPFDRSQMDGFALIAEDTRNAPVKLRIIGESVAGKGFDEPVKKGQAVRIMTGARVPEGADSVCQVEFTREETGFIEILTPSAPNQNIVKKGREIKAQTKVFRLGDTINEKMIASLASFGYADLEVFQKPSVTILATGSEIVDIDQQPEKDQIRNSNSIMLKSFSDNLGLQTNVLPLNRDDLESLKTTIANAVQSDITNPTSQILIITGGVSVGDYDFTKPALNSLGAEIFFEKVSLKPGKPTVFAKLNDCLVFGLPGNPVSVAVTFYMFVRYAIKKMQSANLCELKKGFAVCATDIKAAKERDCYLPVSLSTDENGRLLIESLRFSGSSNFIAFAKTDALVFVPKGQNLSTGDVAEILFL